MQLDVFAFIVKWMKFSASSSDLIFIFLHIPFLFEHDLASLWVVFCLKIPTANDSAYVSNVLYGLSTFLCAADEG
jgi:hypothetical protein